MDRFISDQMPSFGLPLCLDRWTGVCEHVHVVAARLGHADPAVTLRVYAHVIHSAEAAAADIFAQAIKAA